MPWTSRDVAEHNKSAKTAKQKRQWVHVANSILRETGNEARAIRGANSALRGKRK